MWTFLALIVNTLLFMQNPDYKEKDYLIRFHRIDNKVDIIVNDSLVYTSGVIDSNPDFKGEKTLYLGSYLTNEVDEVVIKVYNGRKPYIVKDKHWEIEYVIEKKGIEYEYMWDEGNNNEVGLVFEEKHFF